MSVLLRCVRSNNEWVLIKGDDEGVIMNTARTRPPAGFNPAFATAAEMTDAIRRKEISASELLGITFQRIDLHNPKVNAIIWQDREQAIERAKRADAALAEGNTSGAL